MLSWVNVAIFLIAGVFVVAAGLGLAWLLRPSYPDPKKLDPYECGEVPFGDAQVRFNIRYYIFALIFVVFDIESAFIYPWAVLFRKLGVFGFFEMLVFLLILVVGLVYAWKKRVLEWV
ncbi:MAG: NADH-quinone oxidoreductase subunit A [Bacillota bacterium]